MNNILITDTDHIEPICIINDIESVDVMERIQQALKDHYYSDVEIMTPDLELHHLVDSGVYKSTQVKYTLNDDTYESSIELTKIFSY